MNQSNARYLVNMGELKEAMANLVCCRCNVAYSLHEFEDHLFVEDVADIPMEDRN